MFGCTENDAAACDREQVVIYAMGRRLKEKGAGSKLERQLISGVSMVRAQCL